MHGTREFYNFLGKVDAEARAFAKQHGLLKPTDFVSAMDPLQITAEVTRLGSRKNFAKQYSISTSYLKGVLKTKGVILDCAPIPEDFDLSGELARLGSVIVLCRVYNFKESELRKFADAKEIKVSKHTNYKGTRHSNARGRRGELEYAKIRGDMITKDMNEEDKPQAGWDFEDKSYSKVNVKASQRHRFKAKTREHDPYYYKISTESVEKCDYVAIMCMSRECKTLNFWFLVPVNYFASYKGKTWTFSSGIEAYLVKDEFDCPFLPMPAFIQNAAKSLLMEKDEEKEEQPVTETANA